MVATGDRVLLFDVRTGTLVQSWPDNGPAFEGFGRGLLAGDKIYWPTRNEIQILDQATGLRVEPSIKLQDSFHTTGGNLAVGDGYLIVAQADALVVFCQNSRLIQRYRDEIATPPSRPRTTTGWPGRPRRPARTSWRWSRSRSPSARRARLRRSTASPWPTPPATRHTASW